ncbi:MAG: MBOAT family O-acyltransferase, partial [Chthoniobacterales bacterium]
MLFNSFQFALFFPIVVVLYYLAPFAWRWAILAAASCYFYMAFVPAYILILLGVIVIDYTAGLLIEPRKGWARKALLGTSLFANVGLLAYFKYFNFLTSNVHSLAQAIGWNYPQQILNVILPIGLSFHVFQSMSYTIEVYRGTERAERHFGIYALYVLFFPQLVAGPIERPQNLLHQFRKHHRFDYDRAVSGLRLILIGLFKKVVIADRLALVVDSVYANPAQHSSLELLLGTYFFAFQIYCDFSGYSDIARGAARLLGFELMVNFNAPYLARSVADFWRRWHISLSTWFRDYVYVPLGGNRLGAWRQAINLFVVFLLSGLWHGSAWT